MTNYPRLNIILRTCDRVSLSTDRVLPKADILRLCLTNLFLAMYRYNGQINLVVLDDRSSTEFRTWLKFNLHEYLDGVANINWSLELLPDRNDAHLTNLQKSRASVHRQYDIAMSLPKDELVYFLEDDWLHFPDSIQLMVDNWLRFSNWSPDVHIGIFPEDFAQLHLNDTNPFNSTFIEPCITVAGLDRYFRTVNYTHESFLISTNLLQEYAEDFNTIREIGFNRTWEGDSFCRVWRQPNVKMLMPLGGYVLHIDSEAKMPLYTDWRTILETYKGTE